MSDDMRVVRIITIFEFADDTFDVVDQRLHQRIEPKRVTSVTRGDAYDFVNEVLFYE